MGWRTTIAHFMDDKHGEIYLTLMERLRPFMGRPNTEDVRERVRAAAAEVLADHFPPDDAADLFLRAAMALQWDGRQRGSGDRKE
jgi:hypothetical protein